MNSRSETMLATSAALRFLSPLLLATAVVFCPGDAAALDRTMTSTAGFDIGNGKPIGDAWLDAPETVYFDARGNLYFSDAHYTTIRRLDATTGVVTSIVGTQPFGAPLGDGGPATLASVTGLGVVGGNSFTFDSRGVLYIADSWDERVRAVNMGATPVWVCGVLIAPGNIDTIGGTGNFGWGANGIPATTSDLAFPVTVAIDPRDQGVIFSEFHGGTIRRIDQTTGVISLIAGNAFNENCIGGPGNGDGGEAVNAPICAPLGLAFDSANDLYFTEWTHPFSPFAPQAGDVRKIARGGRTSWDGSIISTYAGDGVTTISSGDGGPAVAAGFGQRPGGLAFDAKGNLFVSESVNNRIRRIAPAVGAGGHPTHEPGIITTVAGAGPDGSWYYLSTDNGKAPTAGQFSQIAGITFYQGRLYFAEQSNGTIRWIEPAPDSGRLITGSARETLFQLDSNRGLKAPFGSAFDSAGDLFVGETTHTRIRRIDPRGSISTEANGHDVVGDSGDDGKAIAATLGPSFGMTFDTNGDLYVSDGLNNRVRRVRAECGQIREDSKIELVIETSFVPGPLALHGGNLYIGEFFGATVSVFNLETGKLTPFAGNGTFGYSGDGGQAVLATLRSVTGVAYDSARHALYISEHDNNIVRKVDVQSGIISTFGQWPDQCPPYGCAEYPLSLALLADYLFVGIDNDGSVWRFDLTSPAPAAEVVVGFGTLDDGSLASQSNSGGPASLSADGSGKLHIVDSYLQRVRRVGVVDILPNQYPNRISLKRDQLIEVAILSTYSFQANSVKPSTITVAGAPVSTGHDGRPATHLEDVNGDGRPDLVFQVHSSAMQLRAGDREAAVLGTTFDGKAFQDADWVTVQ